MTLAICEMCYRAIFVPRLVNGYTCCDRDECKRKARGLPSLKSSLTQRAESGTMETEKRDDPAVNRGAP